MHFCQDEAIALATFLGSGLMFLKVRWTQLKAWYANRRVLPQPGVDTRRNG